MKYTLKMLGLQNWSQLKGISSDWVSVDTWEIGA